MAVFANIDEDHPDKIKITAPLRYKDLIKGLPGSRYKEGQWSLSLNWQTCLALRSTFKDELTVGDELSEWASAWKSERVDPALALRNSTEAEGFPGLYGYQRAGVQFLTTAKRALLCDGLGSGKAQPVSEPVLTPYGFVRMGDIKVGDYVVGKDGTPTRVWGVFPQGSRPIYKVSFKDGSYTFADKDHLWDVQSMKNMSLNRHMILTTQDLMDYGVTTNSGASVQHKFRVPITEPVQFPKRDLPIAPYTLGALLGDGGFTARNTVISSADQEILDRISSEVPAGVVLRYSSQYDYRIVDTTIQGNRVSDALEDLGLRGLKSHLKFIPEDYLYSSVEDRIDILRGLMDTDGTAGKDNVQSFSSTSYALCEGVAHLVRSLGGIASIKGRKLPKGANHECYNVWVRMPKDINPFFVSRKASLVTEKQKYLLGKFISKIEYSHEEDAQCIAVEADDRLYITRDFIVTHNTFTSFATVRNLFETQGVNPFPMLIVCPNSTKISWKRAIEVIWPGLSVQIIDGSATQRRKQFERFKGEIPCVIHGETVEEEKPKPKSKSKKVVEPVCTCPQHVIIMNWEGLKGHTKIAPYGGNALKRCIECGGADAKIKAAACQAHAKELNDIDFKVVIADEAHRMKTASALTTRALKAATGAAEYRFALTGTPIASAPDDLWSILNWLYPDAYPSKTKFMDRFLIMSYNVWGQASVIGIRPEMEQEFFAGIDPILRRMPKEVVLPNLPPVIYDRRDVEMSPKQRKAYEQMRDQMLADLDGELLITTSPLTKMTRLLQLSTCYADVENYEDVDKETGETVLKQKVTLTDPSATLDAFMDDIEGFAGESVVVFSPSKQVINLLGARMDKLKIPYGRITGDEDGIERQRNMDNFQNGKIQFILVTTAAGGTGITLTRARIAVYLGRPWSNIESEQSEGRIHRIGSEVHDSVIYRDYVTLGTVQEFVFEALTEKNIQLQSILRDKAVMRSVIENNAIDAESDVVFSEEL